MKNLSVVVNNQGLRPAVGQAGRLYRQRRAMPVEKTYRALPGGISYSCLHTVPAPMHKNPLCRVKGVATLQRTWQTCGTSSRPVFAGHPCTPAETAQQFHPPPL